MKFFINRASDPFMNQEKPIEEAILDSSEKIKGTNNCFNKYIIEINSLKDLLRLMRETGQDIVMYYHRDKNEFVITIYDDYIE